MNFFAENKFTIILGSIGLAFIAVFTGLFLSIQNTSVETFEENGYILASQWDEEQNLAVSQYRFAAGEQWKTKAGASVTFTTEEGSSQNVPEDSFIHYSSGNMAALKASVLVDLNGYAQGMTNSWYLEAGDLHVYTGSEEMIWKSSDDRLLIASESMKVVTASGASFEGTSEYLELCYIEDGAVLQITDGQNAWQVITRGCQIKLSGGIVYDCETREVLTPQAIRERATAESVNDWVEKTIFMDDVTIDASGHQSVAAQATPSVFRFFLNEGIEGLSGDDGKQGGEGADGKAGDAGEAGEAGSNGGKGKAGTSGSAGLKGGTGIDGINGQIIQGTDVQLGSPAVLLDSWTLSDKEVSFMVKYDETSYDIISFEGVQDREGCISLYDAATGTLLAKKDELEVGEIASAENKFTYDQLQPNTTYLITYTDTYELNGFIYENYRLLERMFTTTGSGLNVSLNSRTAESFRLGVNTAASDDNMVTIKRAVITYTDLDSSGAKVTKTVTVEVDEEGNAEGVITYSAGIDSNGDKVTKTDPMEIKEKGNAAFENILVGLKDEEAGIDHSLRSDTTYPLSIDVEYTTKAYTKPSNGSTPDTSKLHTERFEVAWTTLKKAPTLGGITMSAQKGILSANVLGNYDSALASSSLPYGAVEDPDKALSSITYYLYDTNGTLLEEVTRNDTKAAWFEVDGEKIMTKTEYYVAAEYTWNNGQWDVKEILMETDPDKKNDRPATLPAILVDRGWASATTIAGDGISISFSGNGTGVYNDTNKTNEGITYEAMRGSLMVNLNGSVLSVSNSHRLKVTFCDNRAYRRTFEYTDCEGKQGNIEGSFALPLDVDGLMKNNSYVVTLEGYEYIKASDRYEAKELGSIVLRTATEANIVMGMSLAPSGVGARFYLGASSYEESVGKANLYDKTTGTYTADYRQETAASYRNLDRIIFRLYAVEGDKCIGYKEVYPVSNDGKKKAYAYDQSLLYQTFYGDAVKDTETTTFTENYIGVGSNFAYKFYKVSDTGATLSVLLSEADLETYSGGFYITVDSAYDYTYERYRNSENYDYFDYDNYPMLTEDECINEILINGGTGCKLTGLSHQKQPIDPDSVNMKEQKYKIAIEYEVLENGAYPDLNDYPTTTDLYDMSLDADTAIGIRLQPYYTDTNTMTKTVSFYGTTYEKYLNEWSGSLTDIKNSDASKSEEEKLLSFKFTINMTSDQGAYGSGGNPIEKPPSVYVLSYDQNNPYYTTEYMLSRGYSPCRSGDFGYDWYKYDSSRGYLVFTDFFTRGNSYVFALDSIMDYTINGKSDFSYPEDYYLNFKYNGSYGKGETMRSEAVSLLRQKPRVNTQLIQRTYSDDKKSISEKWQVYLFDPDGSVKPEFFTGNKSDLNYTGGLVNEEGDFFSEKQEYNQENLTLSFAGVSKMQYFKNGVGTGNTQLYSVSMEDDANQAITDENAKKEKINNLLSLMKQQNSDGSFGTTLNVNNIAGEGNYYGFQMRYRRLDDIKNSLGEFEDSQTMMFSHYAAGYADINEVKLETYIDDVSGDSVYVDFIDGKKLSEKVSRIKVTATKVVTTEDGNGGTTETKIPIWENPQALPENRVQKALYCYVEEGDPNYFKFELNDFSRMSTGDEDEEESVYIQFGQGDTLEFTYTLYYHDGTSQVLGEALTDENIIPKDLDENKIFAIRRFDENTYVEGFYHDKDGKNVLSRASALAEYSYLPVFGYQVSNTETVTGNNGIVYQLPVTETYTIHHLIYHYYNAREEYEINSGLYYNCSDPDTGYASDEPGVFELHEIKSKEIAHGSDFTWDEETKTKSSRVTIGAVIPVVSHIKVQPGITHAAITTTLSNFNMMKYPEGEKLHLYYLLYSVAPGTNTKTLVAAQLGETAGNLAEKGIGTVDAQILPGSTYRLYLFMKNCTEMKTSNIESYKDSTIFGSVDYKYGEWNYTNAKAIEQLILVSPYINTVSSAVGEQTLKRDENDNYYVEFTPQNGLGINYVTSGFSFSDAIQSISYNNQLGQMEVKNGREFIFTAYSAAAENENTRMMMAVERCKIGESNWYTILAPRDYYANMIKSGDTYTFCQEIMDADGNVVSKPTDQNILENYGVAYEAPVIKDHGSGGYAGIMKLTYYPGEKALIRPGYRYRVRAVIYQYYPGADMDPSLVSKGSGEDEFRLSTVGEWKQTVYDESTPMVMTQKLYATKDEMNLNFYASNNQAYVANRFYARLYQFDTDTNAWVQVASNAVDKKEMRLNSSNQNYLFKNLEEATDYQVRFYALMDLDYDNYVDKMKNGIPLADKKSKSDEDKLFNGIDEYGMLTDKNTLATGRLIELYQKYFGMTVTPSGYYNLLPGEIKDDTMLIGSSKVITTLSGIGTLGTIAQAEPHAKDTSTIVVNFKEASNLGNLESVTFNIAYMNEDGAFQRYFPGSVEWKDTTEYGDITISLTHMEMNTRQKGTYNIELFANFVEKDENGDVIETQVEQLETYSMPVF